MITKNTKYQQLLLASAIAGLFVSGHERGPRRGHQGRNHRFQHQADRGRGRASGADHRSQDEILESGATNAMEIMNLISANNSGAMSRSATSSGRQTNGNQTASLRGLGGSSTLVLVNGKRLGTFAGADHGRRRREPCRPYPFAAIDRVEVLKDGASAVYGSDAIGGVINFIMRQDFSGVDATAWYGAPTRSGGGEQYQLMATAGCGDLSKDKYNVFCLFNYNQQKSLDQKDRNFSNSSVYPRSGPDIGAELNGTSGQTFRAMYTTRSPATASAIPDSRTARRPSYSGGRCRYDPAIIDGVESIPETKQLQSLRFRALPDQRGLAGLPDRAVLAPGDRASSSSRRRFRTRSSPRRRRAAIRKSSCSRIRPTIRTRLPPPTASTASRWACAIAASCAAIATTRTPPRRGRSSPAPRARRGTGTSTGRSTTARTRPSEQPNVGLLPLHADCSAAQHRHRQPVRPDIAMRRSRQVNALNFTQEALNAKLKRLWHRLQGVRATSTSCRQVRWRSPLGLQAGKETLTQNYNEFLFTGDVTGYGGNITRTSTIRARRGRCSANSNIPIIKNLEGNIAVRYDHYSDFGSTTNPKVSLRYQPVPAAAAARLVGYRLPGAEPVSACYTPQTPGLTGTGQSDPLRCPDPNGPGSENNPDCNTQFVTTIGGNPDLQPEKANQTTIGAHLGACQRHLARRRLVLSRSQGPGQQRHCDQHDPGSFALQHVR